MDDREMKDSCGSCCDNKAAQAPDSQAPDSAVAGDVDALRAEVESLKAKVAENWDLFLRSRADFDNYRRRMEREVAAMIRRGKKDLLLKLLDVVDNFNRALGTKDADAATLRTGLEVLLRQVEGILSSEGVQPVESVGRKFDPAVHEVIAVCSSPGVKEETVTDEIQKGYTHEGDVLRVARVRVARPAEDGENPAQ